MMSKSVTSLPTAAPSGYSATSRHRAIPEDFTRDAREVPQHLRGTLNCWLNCLPCRAKNPHHFLPPGWEYVPDVPGGANALFRHRDNEGRETTHRLTDRYLHYGDGKLRTLMVACSEDIWDTTLSKHSGATWRRTYLRMVSPYWTRMMSWVVDYSEEHATSYCFELLKTIPITIGMMLIPFSGLEATIDQWKAGQHYSPVRYKYYGDAKAWSNQLEHRRGRVLPSENNAYRTLKPRHLCFLINPESDQPQGIDVRTVQDWEADQLKARRRADLRYLFVAYSTEHFSHSNTTDLQALHEIAEAAARKAKIPAYWVACSCMQDPAELESDVYRIADVLRGAQAMIIAVGQPSGTAPGPGQRPFEFGELLAQWGRRMWTFPEVLLSSGDEIAVYTRGSLDTPRAVRKNQFAAQVWGDAQEARQLTDHYLGTLVLSRLELAVLSLRCLYRRETVQYLHGDQAYALMGLLRMRPEVDKGDSPFQAFARLSLANDSDSLLERYLCMLPPDGNMGAWHYMEDAYGSSAWHVSPCVQIAGICNNDSVILDGAWGASIRWKSFFPVGYTKVVSWRRFFADMLMYWNGWTLLAGCLVLNAYVPKPNPYTGLYDPYAAQLASIYLPGILTGVFLILLAIGVFFYTPKLIRVCLGGKFRDVQPALFGIEGYISASTAERAIFGAATRKLQWSTNGSPLSRAYTNEKHELVGVDPIRDPTVKEKVELAKVAMPGQKRIFTLIDTYSMEMTLFEAMRPPTSIFLCATEGGMQRAIGCSYDFTTQLMYKETVLRMPTTVRNRMDRVPRFRIGIRRQEVPVRRVA